MARTPNPRLHALWRERIRRQVAGGLSVEQFCSRENLTTSLFYAWKRRLRLADAAEPRSTATPPPTFLPVAIRALPSSPASPAQPPPIEADLPNGIRLRIPTADPLLACRVLRSIASARTNSGDSR